MIEVLFGESEAASMKAAKNKVVIGTASGPVSVWMAGKKRPPEKPFSGWIEGSPEEVICLGFNMDIGDVREPEADGFYAKELQRLKDFLDEGESVRIWYSDAPYSRCGLYSLCRILQEYDNEIRAVKLPEYTVYGKTIVSHRSWGEVSAEEFAGFLSPERLLSGEEIRRYAFLWSGLMEENSPLRAVVNGEVLSVPEDFYDFLIWKWLKEVPVKEARLIGNILGHEQTGVGDWWYAGRIDYYIKQGKIRVVEDSDNKYARVICRSADMGE